MATHLVLIKIYKLKNYTQEEQHNLDNKFYEIKMKRNDDEKLCKVILVDNIFASKTRQTSQKNTLKPKTY